MVLALSEMSWSILGTFSSFTTLWLMALASQWTSLSYLWEHFGVRRVFLCMRRACGFCSVGCYLAPWNCLCLSDEPPWLCYLPSRTYTWRISFQQVAF
jgi:hypothetical protein